MKRSPLAVLVLLVASTTTAIADTDPRAASGPAAAAPSERWRWYGWQILLADAAVLTTTVIVARNGSDTVAGKVFLVGYSLSGPLVHVVHGNGGRAAGSAALRGGLPLVAGVVGFTTCVDDTDGIEGLACIYDLTSGLAIGAAAAAVIDYAWAIERLPVRVKPVMHASPTAAWLGLAGTF